MLLRATSVAISVAIVTLVATFSVSAHPMEPRLEISVERQIPGGVVDVRGVAFGMEDTVALVLITTGMEVSLGEMITDAEGEFLHIVELPVDLQAGTYYFQATTDHHWVISPPLTVRGTAIMEGGGQGERDEDDGLLAPMPTFEPGVVPGVVTASAPSASSAPVEALPGSSGLETNILILIVLAIVVAAVMLSFIKKKAG